ncbi:hypothetical protein PV04_07427 [Phialophora macrospora]|uniref:Uncharacterized protein n=1 Tax=Phialophora macrospora TaxID=1851006 RepID=A0A0D2FE72_9EURO|nr:hypothetical protein PV04_07427 [Phialophora macrospora]
MRLLHTRDLQVHDFTSGKAPRKYAILSHTWDEEEVTLQDMEKGLAPTMKGYLKLRKSCQRAANDGYEWIWIDACCIDKTSSSELSEAINSMFEYYSHSSICYAYLADIQSLEDLEKSRWFTRGWTLQELLAPRVVIFFDSRWRKLGTKQSCSQQISSATGIPGAVVGLGTPLQICNVAQRMSWASQRQTTRDEDVAYCLLGLFDVHMSPIYGEGAEKAFLRLQEEILRQSADHTLFIWTPKHDPYNQGLLASSPRAFCTHPECFTWMGEFRAEQSSFDPYANLWRLPYYTTKSFYTKGRTLDKLWYIPPEEQEQSTPVSASPVSASLGQSGLQISLHSHIREERGDSRHLSADKKILLFDIILTNDGVAPVHLTLVRETEPEFGTGFVPNRLGAWRRHIYSEEAAGYFKEFQNMSFEQVPVTISQMKTPAVYSGPPPTFVFRGQQSEALVSYVLIEEPEGFLKGKSRRRGSFQCRGGIVILQHSCTQCDPQQKVALCFGGHGTIYQPWCTFGSAPMLGENQSPRKASYLFYESLKYSSARFGSRSHTTLPCGGIICGHVGIDAEKSCCFIVLGEVPEDTHARSAS